MIRAGTAVQQNENRPTGLAVAYPIERNGRAGGEAGLSWLGNGKRHERNLHATRAEHPVAEILLLLRGNRDIAGDGKLAKNTALRNLLLCSELRAAPVSGRSGTECASCDCAADPAVQPSGERMLNPRTTALLLATATILSSAATANAQTVTPSYGSFGLLSGATFGGTGISNAAVAQRTTNGVTIGLSATPRYSSPALTDVGAGKFTATPGISTGAPNGDAGFADWNFDYYVGGSSQNTFFALLGNTTPNGLLLPFVTFTGDHQNSSNLGYSPAFLNFDPNATGVYSFVLNQYSGEGVDPTKVVQSVAINVNVGTTTTPEPSSLALLGTGFVGLGGFIKRRRTA